jgi:RNA-binding protein
MELKGFQRKYLSKLAHSDSPSVMLGMKGLTPELKRQTDEMLELKELIKVKFVDYKSSKKELTSRLAEAVDAELVRLIGNTAILYRMARKPEHRKIKLTNKK